MNTVFHCTRGWGFSLRLLQNGAPVAEREGGATLARSADAALSKVPGPPARTVQGCG